MAVEQHPDVTRLAAARRSVPAEMVGHLSDPAVLVPAVLAVVALHATDTAAAGLGWAALAALFCVGFPYLLLQALVRRGTVADRHVVVRHQRPAPLAAGVLSVLAGVVLLGLLGAPTPVTGLVVTMLVGLAAMALVSLAYKASLHVAVVSGAATVLGSELGTGWWLVLAPAVLLVAWARVRAGRHTVGQAAVGLLVGCAAGATVYPALAT